MENYVVKVVGNLAPAVNKKVHDFRASATDVNGRVRSAVEEAKHFERYCSDEDIKKLILVDSRAIDAIYAEMSWPIRQVLDFEGDCIGYVYLYPPDKPWLDSPEGADVVVNMWVTEEAYGQGFYPRLYRFVREWVAEDWPFETPYCPNKEIPSDG